MPPAAPTAQLPRQGVLRLTLEDRAWFTTAAQAAKSFYEGAPSHFPFFAVSSPTPPRAGLWIQDVKLKGDAGPLTANDLIVLIEKRVPLRVRMVEVLGAGALAPGTADAAREAALTAAVEDKHAEQERKNIFARLADTFRTARALFVLLLVFAILIYAWPWLKWLREQLSPKKKKVRHAHA